MEQFRFNPSNTLLKRVDFKKVVQRPVTAFVTTILIVVMLLYSIGLLKDLQCGKTVINGLNRSFIHADWQHIMGNLFAFFVMSRIEANHGSKFFAILIAQILALETIIELMARQFFDLNCSIGFSGVLFGLVAWELINDKDLDLALFLGLGAMVVAPSMENNRASLVGHFIGALSGVIVGMYYKKK